MYTKEEREGILWEFHRSGLSVPGACRRLPLFPTRVFCQLDLSKMSTGI